MPWLAHAWLAQMDKHQTLDPVSLIFKSSPTGDRSIFFVAKPFDANIAISSNFVLNAKTRLFPYLSASDIFYPRKYETFSLSYLISKTDNPAVNLHPIVQNAIESLQ